MLPVQLKTYDVLAVLSPRDNIVGVGTHSFMEAVDMACCEGEETRHAMMNMKQVLQAYIEEARMGVPHPSLIGLTVAGYKLVRLSAVITHG